MPTHCARQDWIVKEIMAPVILVESDGYTQMDALQVYVGGAMSQTFKD